MSRINDQILNCVFYIYPSYEYAQQGINVGGTGFLVGIPSKENKKTYYYAVTNKHVIHENGTPAIQFNIENAQPLILPTYASDWVFHQNGDDLAVFSLISDDHFDLNKLEHSCIPINLFLTEENFSAHNIGPGSEIFMVGRFIHDAKQSNTPIVRFGNISMLPRERIKKPNDREQESFLVEMRSVGGFSGAPVFVIPTSYRHISKEKNHTTISVSSDDHRMLKLLGINWGHLPIYNSVKIRRDGKIINDNNNYVVESHTGQSVVIPAWKLYELLYLELAKEREKTIKA